MTESKERWLREVWRHSKPYSAMEWDEKKENVQIETRTYGWGKPLRIELTREEFFGPEFQRIREEARAFWNIEVPE